MPPPAIPSPPIPVTLLGVDPEHHIAAEVARLGTFYELDLLEHLASHGRRGGVCMDVGANIGNHSVYLGLFLCDFVLAIEPNPAVHPVLRRNLDASGVQNLVLPIGVGASSGEAEIVLPAKGNVGAARLVVAERGQARVTVPVRTLDDVVREHVDWGGRAPVSLVKLDIEGMELEALQGAGWLLGTMRPELTVEFSDPDKEPHVRELLSGYGYRDVGRFCWTPTHHFVPA